MNLPNYIFIYDLFKEETGADDTTPYSEFVLWMRIKLEMRKKDPEYILDLIEEKIDNTTRATDN